MRAWLSLPQALPILLRHILAYAELAGDDLRRYSRRASLRLFALALAMLGAFFTLALMCVAVLACFWDTPHRMAAILWLLAGFALLTLIALLKARAGVQDTMLPNVSREWAVDRVILDRLLEGRGAQEPADSGVDKPEGAP